MRFSVWAPDARQVDLVLTDRREPMELIEDGWWSIAVPDAEGAIDYRFALDSGEPLPDPRSPWQPQGVEGPSRTVDHTRYRWSDQDFTAPAFDHWIIYELHIGTFTPEGTFDATIEKLDHLTGLGVTAVEILPVNEFSGDRGWGYDGVDLYAPHHSYGGPDALKRFVDACHRKGLAVILDVVYNHFGPAGNYLPRFGPYFTDAYSTPWGEAVNFDSPESAEVRRFFIDNAMMWLRDYHFDALRLDAVHAILDTGAKHFLEELAEEVERLALSLNRPLRLIAESDLNDPQVVRERDRYGYGMDAQWSDDFHHALHSLLTGESNGYYSDFGQMKHLATALERAFVYAGEFSEHRRRPHGREPSGIPGNRFLAYAQNHDQIGNRATGDRLSMLVDDDRLKIAAALVLTAPFLPMLFQGEEWGATTPFQYFTDHHDPELGKAVSEGRRSEFAAFGWEPADVPDPQDVETFRRSKLNWSEITQQRHTDLHAWHKKLIELRLGTLDLLDGDLTSVVVTYSEEERWLVLERGGITVTCNLASERRLVGIAPERRSRLLVTSGPTPAAEGDAVRLPALSVAIYSHG
ncbi:MAG: malto-oligosyltrehalose trehalohydrolase [Actinomycetota bacterium]